RLIPAGTGMKYYRNIQIDPDPTENRKEQDEFDEIETIRGGIDIPTLSAVPGIGDGDDYSEENESVEMEEIEDFDIDEAMNINLEDDEI
ncbi:hypothetical protein OFC55_33640, partial [Escherichia coli]|nr:hypothetical protein [Escherichia coli]